MENIESNDFGRIINRLELIKNLVALEEEEEIENQITKLEKEILDESIIYIIKLLRQKSYNSVIKAIEMFLNKNKSLQSYVDHEISALKLEIKTLESTISLLSEEKTDLQKLILDFKNTESKILGKLLLKILKFRKEQSKGTKREIEAEEDYNSYNEEFKTITVINVNCK